MFFKKAKRFLAGVCVWSLLLTSIDQSAIVAMAAENTVEAVDVATSTEENFVEEVVEEDVAEASDELEVQEEGGIIGTIEGEDVESGNGYTWDPNTGTLTYWATTSGVSDSEWTKYLGSLPIKHIKFAEGSAAKFVGNSAFENCKTLETVDFSNCTSNLTFIADYAFSGCSNLETVIFSDKLDELRIGAFQNCEKLTSITLNSGISKIENNVFNGCSNLEEVILETTNISCANSTNIFAGCNLKNIQFAANNTVVPAGLFKGASFYFEEGEKDVSGNYIEEPKYTTLTIPHFVQEIGANAFANSNLRAIVIEDTEEQPSALASIAESAFSGCKYLQAITFPASLKNIKLQAFNGCESLKSLVIPNTVTTLGNYAFMNCKGIETVSISNAISSLGAGIFQNCTSLKTVEIPSGLQLVSNQMFHGCSSLQTATIASTVTSIGNSAFEGCTVLQDIVVPDSVTEIGNAAFKNCDAFVNPVLPKGLTELSNSLFEDCDMLHVISTSDNMASWGEDLFIPTTVTKIGSNAFMDCDQIIGLVITENVTSIGSAAFYSCTNIDKLTIKSLQLTSCGQRIFGDCLLKKVVFPEGIEKIPNYLFHEAHFTSGTTLTIPATVTEIGNFAICGSQQAPNNIAKIVFEDESQLTTIGNSAFQYCNVISEFTIPGTVTKIGSSAFSECSKLEAITIPEAVTEIGAAAFKGCDVLTTVNYNAVEVRTSNKDIFKDCNIHTILIGEKVTILPAYLFYGANFSTNAGDVEAVLITLTIPASVGEIGEYAFANISNVSKVFFADNSTLKTVGTYAFNECTALTECNLPDSVTTIGNGAFRGCAALEKMDIPASLVNLGNYAFYQCSLITEYVIPAGVVAIQDNTFYGNTALESVTFEGCNITEIGANAFAGCSKLGQIDIPSGTTSIGEYAFAEDIALTEVRIPASVSSIGTDAFKNCTGAAFYVVAGSYADEWLKENGFESQIVYMNTITYVLNGGENDIRNIGGYRDGDTFTFFDAVKPGYSFDGWYLEETFETKVTDLTGRSGDFTLYARWVEGIYKISYELNGGENNAANPESYTYYDDITLLDPVRTGYNFQGWYENSDFSGTRIKEIKAGEFYRDLTLYAKWQPKRVTVTFDGKSANATVNPRTLSVEYDSAYSKYSSTGDLATATREGYLFDGWYTEDGTLITKDSIVSIAENHKLFARWVLDVRVEAPVADYASGSVLHTGTKVMLTTKTPGAYIYYTTDGSEPTMASTLYSEPIEIKENITIRAVGVKDGYKNSEIAEFVYTVVDETSYWGDIVEEDRAQFANAAEVPAGLWIAGVEDTVYTGKAIRFDIRVYDHKTLLTEKKDYTVKYSNNKAAATVNDRKAPTITVTAKGNYKGKDAVKFNILPKDIKSEEITADDMWIAVKPGKFQKPVPVVTWGKTKLKNKKDFTVTYDSAAGYADAGVYNIIITGAGNYTGTRTIKCELTTANLMSKVKVSGVKAATYTGKAITQPIEVKNGSTILTEGTDYTVTYLDNTEVGTATIVLTGKGSYAGIKKVTFKINPVATINKAKFDFNMKSVTYTGSAIELNQGTNPLKVTVTYKGAILKEGTDYVIDGYSKNIDAGTATVMFKGINSYSGTAKKTFKIVAADVESLKLKFVDADGNVIDGAASYAYCKGGTKPAVYLEYAGEVLKEKTDYTLSYKNNKKTGTATVTVKGKKNFKGKLTGSFTITKQDISNVVINVPDVPYQKAANIYSSKPVLTDLDGKKLSSGKDYSATITYTYAVDCYVMEGTKEVFREEGAAVGEKDILPVGTMLKATVKGAGNYTGEIQGLYRIVTGTINKAKVTVTSQEYTGKAIQPGKDQIVVKVGSTILDKKDYEIVGYSKNVAKGTATITLRGTGDYGGTVTAKFKIVEKKFSISSILEMLGF